MRYRIERCERARVVPIGRDPISVDEGDVLIVAVVRDHDHAAEVMQALNVADVRTKLKGKR